MPSEVVYKPVEKIKPIYAGGTITPPKFMPTFYEWLSTKGTWVYLSTSSSGTLYTVPLDNTFFLVGASVLCRNLVASAEGDRISSLAIGTGDNSILSAGCTGAKTSNSTSNSWAIPLKVPSGEVITTVTTAGATGNFKIQGFLVKNVTIPTF